MHMQQLGLRTAAALLLLTLCYPTLRQQQQQQQRSSSSNSSSKVFMMHWPTPFPPCLASRCCSFWCQTSRSTQRCLLLPERTLKLLHLWGLRLQQQLQQLLMLLLLQVLRQQQTIAAAVLLSCLLLHLIPRSSSGCWGLQTRWLLFLLCRFRPPRLPLLGVLLRYFGAVAAAAACTAVAAVDAVAAPPASSNAAALFAVGCSECAVAECQRL